MQQPKTLDQAKKIGNPVLKEKFRLSEPEIFDMEPHGGVYFEFKDGPSKYFIHWHQLMAKGIPDLKDLKVG